MEEESQKLPAFLKWDNRVRRIFKGVSQIATAAMLFVALLSTSDTLMSKLFGKSIPLSTETISYVLVIIVAASIAYIHVNTGHISIAIVKDKYSGVFRLIMLAVIDLAGVFITGFTAYCTFRLVKNSMLSGTRIATVHNSPHEWIFALALAIGFVLLTLAFVWCLVRDIYQYAERKGASK